MKSERVLVEPRQREIAAKSLSMEKRKTIVPLEKGEIGLERDHVKDKKERKMEKASNRDRCDPFPSSQTEIRAVANRWANRHLGWI